MRKSFITLFILVHTFCSFSQSNEIIESETELIQLFKAYRNADYEIRYDSLRPIIKARMEKVLSLPASFEYSFDSLASQIKIVLSDDKKLRIFSWDEMTGGTWHDMAVIAQFETKEGIIKTLWIDTDISENPKGLTDDIIYELYEVEINSKPHYLSFGWGTYGSGHHHKSILIFTIEGDSLNVCSDCIEEKYSRIKSRRTDEINLTYKSDTQTIHFNEFIPDEDIGFQTATGNQVVLNLINGKFLRVIND